MVKEIAFITPQFGDGADIGLAYEQLQLSPVVGNAERQSGRIASSVSKGYTKQTRRHHEQRHETEFGIGCLHVIGAIARGPAVSRCELQFCGKMPRRPPGAACAMSAKGH